MARTSRMARNYVPEQIRRLIRATKRIEQLQSQQDNLSEQIFLDIVDGWSTMDQLSDFVLVSCEGAYDKFVVEQYSKLFDLGLRNPGQKIMVVQQANYQDANYMMILRKIHLAFLRKDTLVTDVNSLTMRLPVEPGRFVWKEFFKGNKLIGGYKILDDTWLVTGPLHNEYYDYGETRKSKNGVSFVPSDAICSIELLPSENLNLFEDYGIDEELLSLMHTHWIRGKSKSHKPTK